MSKTDTQSKNKDRILEIVNGLDRPGKDAVLDYLGSSSYFTRGCYNHHRERGGLAAHSLEVYDHMCAHAGSLPPDGIAVAALFHALGKTRRQDGRGHGIISLEILDSCGFPLTRDERLAIGKHHAVSLDFLTCPLRRALSLADSRSTCLWKRAHRGQKRRK